MMRFNRSSFINYILIVALILLLLAACSSQSVQGPATDSGASKGADDSSSTSASGEKEPIVVGGSFSLTGPAGIYGSEQKNAAQLAVDEINKKGGINGRPLKFVFYDDESKPEKGVENTARLIQQDKVVALFGYGATPVIAASASIVQQAKIPMTVNGGGYAIKPEETYIFGTFHYVHDATRGVLNKLKEMGIKKLALIQPDDALGQVGVDLYQQYASEYGVEIVAVERFKNTDSDISAQMTKIKSVKPDAIQTNATGTPAALVAKTAVQIGLNVPVIISHGNGIFPLLDLMKGVPDRRVIVPSGPSLVWRELPDEHPSKKVMEKFSEIYKERYGEEPDYLAAGGYDAAVQTLEAIEKVGPDPDKIRDYLANLKNWAGAQGVYTRTPENHIGLPGEDMVFVTIADGKFTLFDLKEENK